MTITTLDLFFIGIRLKSLNTPLRKLYEYPKITQFEASLRQALKCSAIVVFELFPVEDALSN